MLAQIGTVPLPGELDSWSFAHAAFHRDTIRVIYEQYGVVLSESVLHPVDPKNMDSWLYGHQAMHRQTNQILGIAGYDLNNLNWQDPASVADWFQAHLNEHQQAGQILGLG